MRRALVLVALCLACSRPERPEASAPSQQPRDGGILIRRLEEDLKTLTPVCTTGSQDAYAHRYLYTPLIYLDRDLRPMPGLASWAILDNGRRYRFVLNRAATFSDKAPVRAHDVLFSLAHIVGSPGAAHLAGSFSDLDWSRTRAIDDRTVDIAFTRPLATQLSRFADLFVIPRHVYATGDVCSTEQAVGSGPYRLTRRVRGKSITLERRADYWGDPVHIQTIVFTHITNHTTAWNALKLGRIHETRVTGPVWQQEHSNRALAQRFYFRPFYKPGYNYIAWNGQHPILRDRSVRHALAMGIPIDTIIRDFYRGTARPLTGPFMPDEPAYNPDVKPIPYDPDAARRLLATAGWHDRDRDGVLDKNGAPLSFSLLIAGEASTPLALILQDHWRRIGVKIDITVVDGTTANEQLRERNYEAAYWAWNLDAEPDLYSTFHSSQVPPRGQNFVTYTNPVADRLIEAARRELDDAKRRALYHELHDVLATDQPYTWIAQTATRWVSDQRIRGVDLSPRMGAFLWYPGEFAWWIADDPAPRL
jgi:peptide/nickel transport system substrate-binding protein